MAYIEMKHSYKRYQLVIQRLLLIMILILRLKKVNWLLF